MSQLAEATERNLRPRNRAVVIWLVLLAAGWTVYEITQNPGLGSVLVCIKLGLGDFTNAWWLYRRDPDRSRAIALFLVYSAWGLMKTAVVAFLMSAGLTAIALRNAVGGLDPAVQALAGTLPTMAAAFLISALGTLLAILIAWLAGKRLWLGAAVTRARCQNFWPPTPFCLGRSNRFRTQILISQLAVWLATIMLVGWFFDMSIVGGLLLVGPAVGVVLREYLDQKLGAYHAQECWPEHW